MITLGVRDLERFIAVYGTGLGFPRMDSPPEVAVFTLNGTWLGLFEDAHVSSKGTGFNSFRLAYDVASEAEVDAVVELAVKAGATLIKKPEKVSWCGYSVYFTGPDGHRHLQRPAARLRQPTGGHVGYSDSCKDGGILSSTRNLYEAQRKVIALADDRHVACGLFHGRGGTIGRGGGPNHEAILSQPVDTGPWPDQLYRAGRGRVLSVSESGRGSRFSWVTPS